MDFSRLKKGGAHPSFCLFGLFYEALKNKPIQGKLLQASDHHASICSREAADFDVYYCN
jgi:hypothetical protein